MLCMNRQQSRRALFWHATRQAGSPQVQPPMRPATQRQPCGLLLTSRFMVALLVILQAPSNPGEGRNMCYANPLVLARTSRFMVALLLTLTRRTERRRGQHCTTRDKQTCWRCRLVAKASARTIGQVKHAFHSHTWASSLSRKPSTGAHSAPFLNTSSADQQAGTAYKQCPPVRGHSTCAPGRAA